MDMTWFWVHLVGDRLTTLHTRDGSWVIFCEQPMGMAREHPAQFLVQSCLSVSDQVNAPVESICLTQFAKKQCHKQHLLDA